MKISNMIALLKLSFLFLCDSILNLLVLLPILSFFLMAHLSKNPISFSFMEPFPISDQSYVSAQQITLSWENKQQPLTLDINALYIQDHIGEKCGKIEKAHFQFNPLSFFFGRFEPQQIIIENPDLDLLIDDKNDIKFLSCQDGKLQVSREYVLSKVLSSNKSSASPSALQKLNIYNGKIHFYQNDDGQDLMFSNLDISITNNQLWFFSLNADVKIENSITSFDIYGDYDPNLLRSFGDIKFKNLSLKNFANIDKDLNILRVLSVPFSGGANFMMGDQGQLETLTFDFSSHEAGRFQINELASFISIENLEIIKPEYLELFKNIDLKINDSKFSGAYNRSSQTFHLQDFEMQIDDGLVINPLSEMPIPITGIKTAFLWDIQNETIDVNTFWLNFSGQSFYIPKIYGHPLSLNQINLKAFADFKKQKFTLLDSFIDLYGPILHAKINLDVIEDSYKFSGDGKIYKLLVSDLPQLWPKDKATNAHEWVFENIISGELIETKFDLDFTLDRDFNILSFSQGDIDVWLNDMELTYLGDLPPAYGVDGYMKLNPYKANFYISAGKVADIDIGESFISLTKFQEEDQYADIFVSLRGQLASYLKIIDKEPLNLSEKMGLNPEDIEGFAHTTAQFSFPLYSDLKLEDVDIRIHSDINDAAIYNFIDDKKISSGNIALDITPRSLVGVGSVYLQSLPIDFIWHENFEDNVEWSSKFDITVPDTNIKNFDLIDIDFSPYLKGNFDGKMHYVVFSSGEETLDFTADLTKTNINLTSAIGYKKQGKKAALTGNLKLLKGKMQSLNDVVLSSRDLNIKARGQFDEKTSKLLSIDIDAYQFKETSFEGNIKFNDQKNLITIHGPILDLTAFLSSPNEAQPQSAASSPDNMGNTPYYIDIDFQKVFLAGSASLNQFKSALVLNDQGLFYINASGYLQNQIIKLELDKRVSPGKFNFQSDNVGDFLTALNITDQISGGVMTVQGTFQGSNMDKLSGNVHVSKYRLKDIPFLIKIVNLASFTGITDLFQSDGILMSHLSSTFTLKNKRLTFSEGHTSGNSMGLTFEGYLDLLSQNVNIKGTLVPAYAVNSFLSNVPVLGDLLLGGKGQGIIAAAFTIGGKIGQTNISINPLATLAPGILRKLFGG